MELYSSVIYTFSWPVHYAFGKKLIRLWHSSLMPKRKKNAYHRLIVHSLESWMWRLEESEWLLNIISTRARLGLAVQHTDACFKKGLSCCCRGREGPPFLRKDTLSFEDVPRDRFCCDFSGTSGLQSLPMVYVNMVKGSAHSGCYLWSVMAFTIAHEILNLGLSTQNQIIMYSQYTVDAWPCIIVDKM